MNKIILILVVSGLLSGPVLVRADASKPLVTLPKGNSYELRVEGDSASVMVPIVPSGPVLHQIRFEKQLVTSNGDSGTALFEAITVPTEAVNITSTHDWGVILITVNTGKVRTAGVYNVQIRALGPTDPAKPSELSALSFDVSLTLPAAKLAPVGTLLFEQVWGQPSCLSHPGLRKLFLSETAGKSRVTRIVAKQVDLVPANDNVSDGELHFATPPDIPPFGEARVEPHLLGTFPLGVSRGTVKITAPELAEPVTVAIEVRAHRHPWLILLLIPGGLILGYLIRVGLQHQIERDQAKLKAADFGELLANEMRLHPDSVFVAAVTKILNALRAATVKGIAADIIVAVTQGQDALKTAATELNSLRDRTNTLVTSIGALTGLGDSLPPGIARPLKEIDNIFADAIGDLKRDAVTAAAEKLNGIPKHISDSIAEPVSNWQTGLDFLLEELARENTLALLVRAETLPEITALRAVLASVSEPENDAEKLKTLVAAIHKTHGGAKNLATRLTLRSRARTGDIVDSLRALPLPDPKALEELSSATDKFGQDLAACLQDPAASLAPLQKIFSTLDEAWEKALLAQIPAAEEGKKQNVRNHVKGRDYAAAAKDVEDVVPNPRVAAATEDAVSSPAPGASETPELALVPEMKRLMVVNTSPQAGDVRVSIDPVRTLAELARAKAAQTLLVGVVTTALGYFLFQEKFIGTPGDMVSIFGWAFAIDLSVEALVQTARGLRP